MALKNEILKILLSQNTVSGEEIASALGVTRAAVWKAVSSLKKDGYKIEAVTNKGYTLSPCDMLSAEAIDAFLPEKYISIPKTVYRTTDSTNIQAKDFALKHPTADCIFIANEQTLGRGRLGRKFVSNCDTGIYISFLLHPTAQVNDATLITTYAAVKVCRAIEKISGLSPLIKWVNDIYINNKKCVGILTEGAVNLESGTFDYTIVGIGVNVHHADFDESLSKIATCIDDECGKSINRNELISLIIEEILSEIDTFDRAYFMDEYRKRSLLTGKNVTVFKESGKYPAKVLGITDSGALLIEKEDGECENLNTGEVSVRLSE